MAEAHVGPLPDGMKHCRICAEPINKAAQKCIHCQSEQSRLRQRLGLSSSVLALLVALGPVLGATLPIMVDIFTPKNSALVFSYQGANEKYVGVLASNRGVRPGSVRAAKIDVPRILLMGLEIAGLDDP